MPRVALEELLTDYAWLRNGEPDMNTEDRDRLVEEVRAERGALIEACEKALSLLNNIGTGKWAKTPAGDALREVLAKKGGKEKVTV